MNDIKKQNEIKKEMPHFFCSVYDNSNLQIKLKNQGITSFCLFYAFAFAGEIIIKNKYNINKISFSEKKLGYYYRRPQDDKLGNYYIRDYIDEDIYNKIYEHNTMDEHEGVRSFFLGNGFVDENRDKSLETVIGDDLLYKNRLIPKYFEPDVNLKEAKMYDFSKYNLGDAINNIKKIIYNKKAAVLKYRINKDNKFIRKIFYKKDNSDTKKCVTININNRKFFDEEHFVTLIGWDDNFSKENFLEQPKINGAWIAINSYDDECYYYISYCYDTKEIDEKISYNFFKVIDVDFFMAHTIYDNEYKYGTTLKRKNYFDKMLLINNGDKITISFIIKNTKEKIKALFFESEYNGNVKIDIHIDNNKYFENEFEIKEGLNFFSLKETIVSKNQIIKITFENIGKEGLVFYLQNEEVLFTVNNIYEKIIKNNEEEICLYKMKSKGEDSCTYSHDGREETFTKFFNNGKKYVVTDISLLTANI